MPRQTLLARYMPSSAEPGPIPTPSGLRLSPSNIAHGSRLAHKPMMEWPKPSTSVSKTASSDAISRFLPRYSKRVKPLEQPNKAVLRTELPRRSTLTGVKPSSRINSATSSPIRMNVHAVAKISAMERKEVSQVKGKDANKCSPAPKAALTLPKSAPISCIWAPPTPSPKDGASMSSRVFPMQRTHNTIKMRRGASDMAHLETKTPP